MMLFSSLRLWLLAGIAIAFLGLGGVALWYRGEALAADAKTAAVEAVRDQLQRDLNQAVSVNEENQAMIERMRVEGERRDRIIVGMADEISDINLELLDKTEALNRAKEADADVSRYLNSSIPPSVRCLRDPKACPAPGNN